MDRNYHQLRTVVNQLSRKINPVELIWIIDVLNDPGYRRDLRHPLVMRANPGNWSEIEIADNIGGKILAELIEIVEDLKLDDRLSMPDLVMLTRCIVTLGLHRDLSWCDAGIAGDLARLHYTHPSALVPQTLWIDNGGIDIITPAIVALCCIDDPVSDRNSIRKIIADTVGNARAYPYLHF